MFCFWNVHHEDGCQDVKLYVAGLDMSVASVGVMYRQWDDFIFLSLTYGCVLLPHCTYWARVDGSWPACSHLGDAPRSLAWKAMVSQHATVTCSQVAGSETRKSFKATEFICRVGRKFASKKRIYRHQMTHCGIWVILRLILFPFMENYHE
jgi:hypothetical protein